MGILKEGSENIKRFGQMFKSMIDLADELDKIDSLENYVNELEAKKNLALQSISDKETDCVILEVKIEKLLAKIAELEESFDIKYKEQAFNLSKLELDFDSSIKTKSDEFQADMDFKLNKFQGLMNDKEVDLKNLEDQIIEKSKKLEKINDALNKIKDKI